MTKANFIIELDTDGDVDLRGTRITELPDNLKVGGTIYGFNPPAPIAPNSKRPDAAPDREPQPGA